MPVVLGKAWVLNMRLRTVLNSGRGKSIGFSTTICRSISSLPFAIQAGFLSKPWLGRSPRSFLTTFTHFCNLSASFWSCRSIHIPALHCGSAAPRRTFPNVPWSLLGLCRPPMTSGWDYRSGSVGDADHLGCFCWRPFPMAVVFCGCCL